MDYTKLESEDDLIKKGDEELHKINWPNKGQIEFHDVTMRYRETLEPSVRQLDFTV